MPGIFITQQIGVPRMNVNLWKMGASLVFWCFWAVRNVLILPAGMMLLLIGLLFIHDKTTPGEFIVGVIKNADTVTNGVQWKWRECQSRSDNGSLTDSNIEKDIPPRPPVVLAADCPEVISDGAGYASHIDRSMINVLGMLWAVFAFICIGLSYLLRNIPHVSFTLKNHSKDAL